MTCEKCVCLVAGWDRCPVSLKLKLRPDANANGNPLLKTSVEIL
jgi:hypothetical protein